jgi:hypothetical protein
MSINRKHLFFCDSIFSINEVKTDRVRGRRKKKQPDREGERKKERERERER